MLERLGKQEVLLTEGEKLQDNYLHREIDATIAACITADKDRLHDAYNLRNGERDIKKYAYLWEAYGLEFPSQLRHIPTLRPIFDKLVGQAITQSFNYKVSCTDSESISHIFDEYRDAILKDIDRYVQNKIMAAQMIIKGGEPKDVTRAQEYLKKLQDKYQGGKFKTDLEKYAQTVLSWSIERFKIKAHYMTFMEDLVCAGETEYQVKVKNIGEKPLIRTLNPLNVYYTKTSEVKFIKDCPRAVIRNRIPVTEAWTLYGHKMKEDDRERFIQNWGKFIVGSDIEIVGYDFGTLEKRHEFLSQKGMEIPMIDETYVEWKANTKVPIYEVEETHVEGVTANRVGKAKKRYKYRLDLFEGTRLGEDLYVDCGRSKHVVRDPDDPSNVSLTINGMCYNDRNGKPYSMVLKTETIAEKIDILHYHAETLLATSGTKALMVNFPDIPVWLGENEMQRLMKWLGLVKQGVGLIDLSSKGPGVGQFNNMTHADMSLSNAIITIFDMIERLEATAYKVTGVSRQSVGEVTQTDGKGTSEIAIQGSQIVTAPLFAIFNQVVESFLTDIVNACRVAYSEGIQGQILLGEEGQRIFSIKKGKFNLAHFNVHVNGDGTQQRDMDELKLVAHKLIDAQLLNVEMAVDMVTIKSLTELKEKMKASLQSQKESDTSEMQSQLEQYQKELEKAMKTIEQFKADDAEIKRQELELKKQDSAAANDLKNRELQQKEIFEAEKLKLESKRVDLEALQLTYDAGGNNEIKNN